MDNHAIGGVILSNILFYIAIVLVVGAAFVWWWRFSNKHGRRLKP